MNLDSLRLWLTRSIARKLVGAFFAVFLLTYLATALVVLNAVRTTMTESELEALTQLSQHRLNELDARMEQMAVNLRAWSYLDVMNDLTSGDVDKRVTTALESLKRDYGLKGQLYVFDSSQRLVSSSNRTAVHIRMPALWQTGDGIGFTDKHFNPMGSGSIVALSVPVRSTFLPGYSLGTLVLTYPWDSIRETLSDKALLVHDGMPPLLLEARFAGTLVGTSLAAVSARKGWLEMGGGRFLVSHAVQGQGLLKGWRVIEMGDTDRLYGHLYGVALQLAGLCLFLAFPLTLAIRWLAMRLSAPLRDLTRVVAGITETGDLAWRVELRSNDELGQLAMAFNNMAARLQGVARERDLFVQELRQFAEELETKVEARTCELTFKNTELFQALESLRSAQVQLVQQEKMASLGQLVAGVAHEINNPIGFIYANFPYLEEYIGTLLDLLELVRTLPMPVESARELESSYVAADLAFLREDLMKIVRSGMSGASRVKEIVTSLKSFSRLDEAALKEVRLEDGLDDTLAILNHYLKARIKVVKDYRFNQPVTCHPGQLNQVFMNILHNAIQAIQGQGSITVSTAQEEEWAFVCISDSGPGIPEEILGRIFDPFFTTKKVGEGTGLGLSISYGIVEKHGGRIEVESKPGQGTRFAIYLPRSAPSAVPPPGLALAATPGIDP